jgi:hypothetical protein
MASDFKERHVNIRTGDSNASEKGQYKTFTIVRKNIYLKTFTKLVISDNEI